MKIKNILQYIATPARVFMTALIILLLLAIIQGFSISIEEMFIVAKRTTPPKSEAALTQEEERIERIKRSAKEFLPDGTIHLVDRVEHISGRKYREKIYDVNDNLLWEGLSDKKPYEYLSLPEQSRTYQEIFSRRQMRSMQRLTPGFSRQIEIPVGSEDIVEQIWRYKPSGCYFVGYDMRKRKIGYLGSNGFSDSKSEVEPFGEFRQFTSWCPVDSENLIMLWQTRQQIHQIDFEKRDVELIFESADSDIIEMNLHAWKLLAPEAKGYVDREKYRPMMHCQTMDGKHHLILRESKQQFSFELRRPFFIATRQEIFVRNTDSDTLPIPTIRSQELIDKWVKEVRDKSWNYWVELYKLDNQGNLKLLNRYDWVRTLRLTGQRSDRRPVVRRSISQFSPLMYDLFLRYLGRKIYTRSYTSEQRGTFFYDLVQAIMYISPQNNIINMILSVLMMGFVFWHGWPRRTTWAKFIFWVIFTGLFNIVGLLTYLALNHTAVVQCAACGKRRGLAQVECVRCKAQLPAPERGKLDLIYSI
jgi:hypothetical protein